MSDRAILEEMGRRIRRKRLDRNLPQETLARRAGLNRTTISQLERGSSATLLTLVQVLRALDALDALEAMLPDPGPSPLELARLKGRERRRASRQRRGSEEGEPGW